MECGESLRRITAFGEGTSARQTSTSVTESGDARRSPKPAVIFMAHFANQHSEIINRESTIINPNRGRLGGPRLRLVRRVDILVRRPPPRERATSDLRPPTSVLIRTRRPRPLTQARHPRLRGFAPSSSCLSMIPASLRDHSPSGHVAFAVDSKPPHGFSPFGHVASLLSKLPTSLRQFCPKRLQALMLASARTLRVACGHLSRSARLAVFPTSDLRPPTSVSCSQQYLTTANIQEHLIHD